MAKVMTTPCIVVIQTHFYKKRFPGKIIATLFPIMIGVFLNTYYDIRFDFYGVLFATVAVFVTSINQIWIKEKQHEFQINPMQLLYFQAPLAATLLMFLIPFFEPVFGEQGIFSAWSLEAVLLIILTGIIAFLINLTMFWIIGPTSPLTYNMMGHIKFCLTLLGSFFLFHDILNYLQIIGIILAFSGVITYTYLKM
jgi:solute carrier family 35 protein E3